MKHGNKLFTPGSKPKKTQVDKRTAQMLRKNAKRLGIWYTPFRGLLRLITLSDSAVAAQDHHGLVMRGCLVL